MMVQDRQWLAQQDSVEWWVHVIHQDGHELQAAFVIDDAEDERRRRRSPQVVR